MNVWSRLAGDPKTRIEELASGTTRSEVPGSGPFGRRDTSIYPLTSLIMNVPHFIRLSPVFPEQMAF